MASFHRGFEPSDLAVFGLGLNLGKWRVTRRAYSDRQQKKDATTEDRAPPRPTKPARQGRRRQANDSEQTATAPGTKAPATARPPQEPRHGRPPNGTGTQMTPNHQTRPKQATTSQHAKDADKQTRQHLQQQESHRRTRQRALLGEASARMPDQSPKGGAAGLARHPGEQSDPRREGTGAIMRDPAGGKSPTDMRPQGWSKKQEPQIPPV